MIQSNFFFVLICLGKATLGNSFSNFRVVNSLPCIQRNCLIPCRSPLASTRKKAERDNGNSYHQGSDDDEWLAAEISEVIQEDQIGNEEADEWIPDREKAKKKREKVQELQSAASAGVKPATTTPTSRTSPYTEEEEDVIRSMGGRGQDSPGKREPGYLGDSTLQEIATDYGVPVCYLADVLCMWGVPVPINVHDRLGDLVTGEQAFAILEAVNSLDIAALNDRYSNQSLVNLCYDWDIELSSAFEMAMKEGWSLPFGVQTVLRVEQEEELLRVLGGYAPSA